MPCTRLRGYPCENQTRAVEIDFVFVCAPKRTCFSAWMEIDLVVVWGSKLTWFLCAGWKWLVFSVRIDWLGFCVGGRNWLSFCVRAENELVLCGYWNLLGFIWADEIDLMSAWEIEIDLISVKGSELTWFCVGVGNDLVLVYGSNCFVTGHLNWFDFSMGIEIDLVSVLRPKSTCFFVWWIEIGLILV